MAWQLLLTIGLLAAEPGLPTTNSPETIPLAVAAAEVPALVRKADREFLAVDWLNAAALYREIVARNPNVGHYWYRLGEAESKLGHHDAAILAFENAEELGSFRASSRGIVHRGEAAYHLALAHAALGQDDRAKHWVATSLSQGVRDIRKFHAPAFAKLLEEADFRQQVWYSTAELSRDDGLRRDLKFALHELKRIHFSPFRATPEAEIDAQTESLLADIPRLNDDQVFVRLMAIVRMFGDAHTRMLRDQPLLPVRLFVFPEGLHVVAATPQHANLVGARVTRIGNVPAADAIAQGERVVARENPMTPRWEVAGALQSATVLRGLGFAGAEGPIEFEFETADGDKRTEQLEPLSEQDRNKNLINAAPGCTEPLPLYLQHRGKIVWFEPLPDGKTMFCQLNGIAHGELTFQKSFERLFEAVNAPGIERLVLDLRFNNGGNTFLIPPLIEGVTRCDKLRQPGKLFVIISRDTFSAALNTTAELERRTSAILVGEPTSSPPNFVGESVQVVLPYSRWPISISDLTWQSSYPMDYRVWVAPAIHAPPSVAALRNHQDPALDAITEFVRINSK